MFKQIFMIVVLSILFGLGARVVQEQPVPFWGFPEPIKLIPPKADGSGVAKITSDDAFPPADQPYAIDYGTTMGLFAKKKRENINFVDSRDPELFAEGHIPGRSIFLTKNLLTILADWT